MTSLADKMLEPSIPLSDRDIDAETRPYHPSVTKGATAKRPLHRVLHRLQSHQEADKSRCQQAYEFLNLDFETLSDRQSEAKAFSNASQALDLLGPLGKEYRESILDKIKILERYLLVQNNSRKTWFEQDVKRVWSEVLPLLEEHLPTEIWSEIREMCNNLFSGEPPL